MNNEKKFHCEICNFNCNFISQFNQHLETNKHKNNGKIIRKDNSTTKCKLCKFETNHSSNLRSHILANHSTIEEKKTLSKYYCDICNFGTYTKILYERHCKTIKHKNNTN